MSEGPKKMLLSGEKSILSGKSVGATDLERMYAWQKSEKYGKKCGKILESLWLRIVSSCNKKRVFIFIFYFYLFF